jgi:hypothetical protein
MQVRALVTHTKDLARSHEGTNIFAKRLDFIHNDDDCRKIPRRTNKFFNKNLRIKGLQVDKICIDKEAMEMLTSHARWIGRT